MIVRGARRAELHLQVIPDGPGHGEDNTAVMRALYVAQPRGQIHRCGGVHLAKTRAQVQAAAEGMDVSYRIWKQEESAHEASIELEKTGRGVSERCV